jgi:hypothetical protein
MKDNNTVVVGNCETCGHFPTQFIEENGVVRSKAIQLRSPADSGEPICDCGVCNTCLHPWNNYPTAYGESK